MVRQLFEESRYCNFYLLFNEIRYCNLHLLFEEIRYCNDHLLFEEIICCNFHLLGTPKQLNLNMPDSEHSLMFSSSTLRTEIRIAKVTHRTRRSIRMFKQIPENWFSSNSSYNKSVTA